MPILRDEMRSRHADSIGEVITGWAESIGRIRECLSKIVQGAKTQQKHTHGMTKVHLCADFGPRSQDKMYIVDVSAI